MKSLTHLRLAASILLATTSYASLYAQQDAVSTFEKARILDENNTNLGEAIALYLEVADSDGERALSAEASLRAGLLYERLGRVDDAQDIFETVLRTYGDQEAVARQAEKRITARAVSQSEVPGVVLHEVWSGAGVDILGAPSVDGRYLSFVDWSTGDLAMRDLQTEVNQRLTDKGNWMESIEYAEYSTFSQDGRQVAYSWFDPHTGIHDLRVVASDGKNQRVVYENDETHYIQPEGWSTNGQDVLVLLTLEDRSNEIALIPVADGSKTVLKSLGWRIPSRLSLSPDGKFVAYDVPAESGRLDRDIFVLNTESGDVTTLVDHPANDHMPIWSVDGSAVLFISDRTGTADLWEVRIGEGRQDGYPSLIRRNVGNRAMPMGFTSDGALYFGQLTGVSDVFVAEVDMSTGRLLTDPKKVVDRFEGSNSSPEWSPDGRELAMVQTTSPMPIGLGVATISIISTEGGPTRTVSPPLNRLGFYSDVRWSPDGEAFLAVSEDMQNHPGIYRIDAETGEVRTIAQTDAAVHITDARWFPDGAALIYVRADFEDGSYSIVRRDLLTETELTLYKNSSPSGFIRTVSLSPDGGKVAFIEEDHSKGSRLLRYLSLQDGKVSDLTTPPDVTISHSTGLVWSPDGRQILFGVYADGGDMSLWTIRIDTGEANSIGLTKPGLSNVRFHPDGKRIAFVAGSYSAEVWALSNFLDGDESRD